MPNKKIIGFSNYTIDIDGVIRTQKGKAVKQSINNGYKVCVLRKENAKKFTKVYIHKCLGINFLGATDLDLVTHIDGNKINNNLSNLMVKNKTRLDENEICEMYKDYSIVGISDKLGVSKSGAYRIIKKKKIPINRKKRRDLDEIKICKIYKEFGISKALAMLDVSSRTIYKILKRNNIPLNKKK